MKTLLTFTGFHDPYSEGLIEGEEHPGPVLTLALHQNFDRIVLIATPNTENNTTETAKAISEKIPDSEIVIKNISLHDPTNYSTIFAGLKEIYSSLSSKNETVEYYIGISSGTPQMHACWLLLAASGEIPARILMTRPPRFVSKNAPIVQEVDFSQSAFPLVRRQKDYEGMEESPDLEIAVHQLGLIGDHPKIQGAIHIVSRLAPTDYPVLILGETGTGKEVFAKLVHVLSGRKGKFVPVNCAGIPGALAESMFFGHVKGAFTGASSDQKGEFEKADGGTLFLDELGELSLDLQAKLLRAIQEGVIQPVGSPSVRKVNVRIVAATNKDIHSMIADGDFREDLYHRLSTGELVLPPLRERKSDIAKIALNILDSINRQHKKKSKFTPEAMQKLTSCPWSGNIRELQNVLERTVMLSSNEVIGPEDILFTAVRRGKTQLSGLPDPEEGFSIEEFVGEIRKSLFKKALELSHNNQSEAARRLGVSPQAVHKFLKEI